MMNSDAILYAVDFCNKYKDHNINGLLINDLCSTAEFVAPFMLVQYKIVDDKRIILSVFFDHELWDKKVSSWKPVSTWFKEYDNEYMFNIARVTSIRKFLMRLA